MKTVSIIALLILAGPALAQSFPPQANPRKEKLDAITGMLHQSDQSRLDAYAAHEAYMARAFGRKQNQSVTSTKIEDIEPAAGSGATSVAAPVPTYTYVAPPVEAVPVAPQNETRSGGGQEGTARSLPLGIGNVPYKN